MKKANVILKDMVDIIKTTPIKDNVMDLTPIFEVIKQAQRDAIEETIDMLDTPAQITTFTDIRKELFKKYDL